MLGKIALYGGLIIVVLMALELVLGLGAMLYMMIIEPIVDSISGGITKHRKTKQNDYVRGNSILIEQAMRLNKQEISFFQELPPQYVYKKTCRSKKEYDKTDLYDYFCASAYRNSKELKDSINKANDNNQKYKLYNKQYEEIQKSIDTEGLGLSYRKTEVELLEEIKKKPVIDFDVIVSKEYYTPKKMKRHYDEKKYLMKDIIPAIEKRKKEKKETRDYLEHVERERSKVTESLRYEVFKRDNFRCVICGASARDGAKLQVDHIKPVSAYGTSDMDNLQTLCDRCNRGKGATFDD